MYETPADLDELQREIDLDAPEHADILGYFKEVYGASWDCWHQERYREREGAGFNAWIEPGRLYTLKPRG